MSILEMAKQYYPRLWDDARILALQKAGKLTADQVGEIFAIKEQSPQ